MWFSGVNFPIIKLVPRIRHLIGSGFFCEAGVKKLAAAFSGSGKAVSIELIGTFSGHSLFIVDSTFRRSGGGEMTRVGEAVRLIPPSDILRARLRGDVLTLFQIEVHRE